MRFIVGLLLLLTLPPAFAAAPPGQTLEARLALNSLPGLEIVASSGDEAHANYTLVSAGGVRPVLAAVQNKLVSEGWSLHPSLGPDTPGSQARAFVLANEFLEARAAPTGQRQRVSLSVVLVVGDAPRQLAVTP